MGCCFGLGWGGSCGSRRRYWVGGGMNGQIAGADGAVGGLEDGGLEDGGEFADIAGPGVLKQPGQRAGAEDGCGLLVVAADSVDEGLGQWSDVFAMFAEGWDGETGGAEAEGEVGEELVAAGQLAQGGVRGDQKQEARGIRRIVLKGFEEFE